MGGQHGFITLSRGFVLLPMVKTTPHSKFAFQSSTEDNTYIHLPFFHFSSVRHTNDFNDINVEKYPKSAKNSLESSYRKSR